MYLNENLRTFLILDESALFFSFHSRLPFHVPKHFMFMFVFGIDFFSLSRVGFLFRRLPPKKQHVSTFFFFFRKMERQQILSICRFVVRQHHTATKL